MDLYTLTNTFLAKDVIDQYISAIWTERYSSAGDVKLVVPPTPEMFTKLKEGTYLALRGSKEVMELKTQSFENNLLTVVGRTMDTFLDERLAWFKDSANDDAEHRVLDFTDDTRKPGEFLSHVVDMMVINPVPFSGSTGWVAANIDWDYEKIPHLSLGPIDTSGVVKRLTLPLGSLYKGLQQVAEQEKIGMSLYLDSADPIAGYSLKFKTYSGVDRTTGSSNELVRLLPDMDSLSDVKEIRSIDGYKNVCYVFYKGIISIHYADPEADIPEGLNRRVLLTDAEGEPVGHKYDFSRGLYQYTQTIVSPEDIAAFREQNARDALANHNYIRAVDGQTSPNNDYKFGIHYGLGDLIELMSFTGSISKARITEYIRSHDESGEKAYPTISVVTDNEGG